MLPTGRWSTITKGPRTTRLACQVIKYRYCCIMMPYIWLPVVSQVVTVARITLGRWRVYPPCAFVLLPYVVHCCHTGPWPLLLLLPEHSVQVCRTANVC